MKTNDEMMTNEEKRNLAKAAMRVYRNMDDLTEREKIFLVYIDLVEHENENFKRADEIIKMVKRSNELLNTKKDRD